MLRLLAELPPRPRAVVVLRYYEDLPEAEIARVLDIAPGTVKSQAARGLARLRTLVPRPGAAGQAMSVTEAGRPAAEGELR